jgi:hypothetical protein
MGTNLGLPKKPKGLYLINTHNKSWILEIAIGYLLSTLNNYTLLVPNDYPLLKNLVNYIIS